MIETIIVLQKSPPYKTGTLIYFQTKPTPHLTSYHQKKSYKDFQRSLENELTIREIYGKVDISLEAIAAATYMTYRVLEYFNNLVPGEKTFCSYFSSPYLSEAYNNKKFYVTRLDNVTWRFQEIT